MTYSNILGMMESGKRSLQSQQIATQVTGHNIANINTPGYSRQEAMFEATHPIDLFAVGQLGTGVTIDSIRRIHDQFLEASVLKNQSKSSSLGVAFDYYSRVEGIFNESTTASGISNSLTEFWNSWQNLANNTSGAAERVNVIEKASTLATRINRVRNDLVALQSDADSRVSPYVDKVNALAEQVSDINEEIRNATIVGGNPNDLMDKRDSLIDQISQYVGVETVDRGYYIDVKVDGNYLVYGTTDNEIEAYTNSSNNNFTDLRWKATGINISLNSGELSATISARDTVIPKYITGLDTMATELIRNVNNLQASGVGITGYSSLTSDNAVSNPANALNASGLAFTPVNGSFTINVTDNLGATVPTVINITAGTTTLNSLAATIGAIPNLTASVVNNKLVINAADANHTFTFSGDTSGTLVGLGLNTFFSGSTAADIAVNSTIAGDSNKVAAAQSLNPGDNTNALAIAALTNQSIAALGNKSIGNYYNGQIGALGAEAERARKDAELYESISISLKNQKEAISGVSLDEEMVNLQRFQRAFEGAAKYIVTVDEMIQTVLDLKR